MRSTRHALVFVCFVVSSALSGLLAGTSWAQGTDPVRSPTFGKPASKFVSGCEIYFFGEYLEPIEGPDGTLGYLIEKTDSNVTLNGRRFFSPYDPPRKSVEPLSEKIKHRGKVIEEAMAEIRRLAVGHATIEGAYYIDSVLYADKPQPYTTKSGDTVMLDFCKDEGHIIYEGAPLVFPLKLNPVPPKEERDKKSLDMAYRSLAEIRPGFIILIGRGYQILRPLADAPALKAALAKIPALARLRHKGFYEGEWIYEWLKIDGYTFDSSIISDFVGK